MCTICRRTKHGGKKRGLGKRAANVKRRTENLRGEWQTGKYEAK